MVVKFRRQPRRAEDNYAQLQAQARLVKAMIFSRILALRLNLNWRALVIYICLRNGWDYTPWLRRQPQSFFFCHLEALETEVNKPPDHDLASLARLIEATETL